MREPGIYPDLDIESYHAEEGISNSGISLILDCPQKYWYEYINTEKEEEADKGKKDKFLFGSAFHTLVLEQNKFNSKYFPMKEKVNLTTNAGKALYAKAEEEAKGREIIRYEDFIRIEKMAEVARNHSLLKEMKNGKIEHSIFWNDVLNARLRTRPDIYNDEIIIDLKTTESIASFARSIAQYGYHRQAAMQIDGLQHFDGIKREFRLLVIEKKAPYLTKVVKLLDEDIEKGRTQYKEGAFIYQECLMNDEWPGYEQEFYEIALPRWAITTEEF